MSTESATLLVIDDDPDIVKAARLLLGRHGYTTIGAASPDEAWTRLADAPVDAILLDLNFARGRTSGEEGFAMLDRLLAADRDVAVVVVTGHSGIAVAVQAMRAGASDFVIKPWSNERLVATVDRAVALRRARRAAAPVPPLEERLLLGEAPAIDRVRMLVSRVAPSPAAVLVRGPAGSGKSLVARLIHGASTRAERPLVVLDAAALPPGEALADRLIKAADATVLIEDVDAVPRALQLSLARLLGTARVIATSRLERAALRTALADDLLFRLNTVEIDLPPLAARREDVVLLARHFLALFAGRYGRPAKPLTDAAAQALTAQGWPDDVRGLRQAAERAVLLGTGDARDLADFVLPAEEGAPPGPLAADLNLDRGERALVAAALERHAFNVSRAAAELGLTRAALYRRMTKHGL